MIEDRARLLAAAQSRNVEVHADDAQPGAADAHRRRDCAARFERRQVQHMAFLDLRVLADEQGSAVPADRIGAAFAQVDRDTHAMLPLGSTALAERVCPYGKRSLGGVPKKKKKTY